MMSDATCKTCPWWCPERYPDPIGSDALRGQCRIAPPTGHHIRDCWPYAERDDWCGSHPDRHPLIECATTTLVTHDDDGPSAADMRRIVDALEKMATCAARAKS